MRVLQVLKTGVVTGVALSPDASRLAVSLRSGQARVARLRDPGRPSRLIGTARGRPLCFTPDGRHVLAWHDRERTSLGLWAGDGREELEVKSFFGPNRPEDAFLCPDGSRLVWLYRDRRVDRIRCVSTDDGRTLWDSETEPYTLTVAFAPRAGVAARVRFPEVIVVDIDTGGVLRRFPTHAPGWSARLAALSPDGRLLAGVFRQEVRVVDTEGGTTVASFTLPGPAEDLAFGPDGRHLFAAADGLVRVREVGSWRELPAVDPGVGPVHALAFSADGVLAAAGGEGGRVAVWDAA